MMKEMERGGRKWLWCNVSYCHPPGRIVKNHEETQVMGALAVV
jgi:hypothetical protein